MLSVISNEKVNKNGKKMFNYPDDKAISRTAIVGACSKKWCIE